MIEIRDRHYWVCLVSATLPNEILEMTSKFMTDPVRILVKRDELTLEEERKTLDRELARAKVTANRVATVVANEWKDANDKVMPVKQWLEERRFLQGEMQQLRDKLVITRSGKIDGSGRVE